MADVFENGPSHPLCQHLNRLVTHFQPRRKGSSLIYGVRAS
jgi:hypothetical protein